MSRILAIAAAVLLFAAPGTAQSPSRPAVGAVRLPSTAATPMALRALAHLPGPPYGQAGDTGPPLWPFPGIAPAQTPPDRWFAEDKLRHFFLSFGATGFAFAGVRATGAEHAADWFAPAAAMSVGLAKEVADDRRGWGFSLRDLVWDAAGVGAAMLVLKLGDGA